MKITAFPALAFTAVVALAATAFAQGQPPRIEGAWVRASVAGQQGTGAFMKLTAAEKMELVGVSTPVAGVAEVHQMKLEGEVMRMRAIDKLELPAGRTVELKPGGYHLMLQDLKQPLANGTTVPLTLVFRNASGAETKVDLKVPVSTTAPGAGTGRGAAGHKMEGHSVDVHKR